MTVRRTVTPWVKPPGYVPRPFVFDARTDDINAAAQLAAAEDRAAGRHRNPSAVKTWKWMGQWVVNPHQREAARRLR